MDEAEEILVPVLGYLQDVGFSEPVAVAITMHALLSQVMLTVEEIKVLAEEMGYTLPQALTHFSYKDRN
jgi:hypothetical protein